MQLNQIAGIFEECFQDAAAFERDIPGTVIETGLIQKEKKKWLVIAAGIDTDEAWDCFSDHPKRAERAGEPVRLLPHGRLSLRIVLRDIVPPFQNDSEMENVATFAPGRGIPFVQLRDGSYVRCWDIQDPEGRVFSLRWELDLRLASNDPREHWLRTWKRHLNFNPAHSPSHLHINAPAFVPNAPIDHRIEHSAQELRLGIGVPNPLGLILSLAAWLRAIPYKE